MNQFILDNKEILSFCASTLGILLSLAFRGILSWRHKICMEYKDRQDAAIKILRGRFVREMSSNYSTAADERRRQKTAIEEIYERPEHQEIIRQLAKDLENQSRVNRLFRGLVLASQASFGFLWAAIIGIVVGIAILWSDPPPILWSTWAVISCLLFLGFVTSTSAMWVLDGRFFRLIHRITEPEAE